MSDADCGSDLIERLALEAWGELGVCLNMPQVERFAALIAEECAKVCEDDDQTDGRGTYTDTDLDDAFNSGTLQCAAAIRAKFSAP